MIVKPVIINITFNNKQQSNTGNIRAKLKLFLMLIQNKVVWMRKKSRNLHF